MLLTKAQVAWKGSPTGVPCASVVAWALGDDPAAAPQPKHPRISHRQVGLLARAQAKPGQRLCALPCRMNAASGRVAAKVADASQTNVVSGCRRSNTHARTWHQMSKAQKHRKRAVSTVPSCLCLLSPRRSAVNQKKRRKNEWALEYMGRVGAIGSSDWC